MDDIIIPKEAQPYQLRALLGDLTTKIKEYKIKVIQLKVSAGNAETNYKRKLAKFKILHRNASEFAGVVNSMAENEESVIKTYDDWQVKQNAYELAKAEYEVLKDQNMNIKLMLRSAMDEFHSA